MSADSFCNGFIIASVIAGGFYYFNKDEKVSEPPQAGRYEIITRGEWKGWLLDTATGDTWEWITIVGEDNKDAGRQWQAAGYDISPNERAKLIK